MHHRRSIRKAEYDYSQPGYYFVTICTRGKETWLDDIASGVVLLSPSGKEVSTCWETIPEHHLHVSLDTWVIMPNHVHGILHIIGRTENTACMHLCEVEDCSQMGKDVVCSQMGEEEYLFAPTSDTHPHGTVPGSLGAVIQSFKAETTRRINKLNDLQGSGNSIWQRNYYEHIVRNARELAAIRTYILDNPANWLRDAENPHRT